MLYETPMILAISLTRQDGILYLNTLRSFNNKLISSICFWVKVFLYDKQSIKHLSEAGQ
jgi:hypothetical protein